MEVRSAGLDLISENLSDIRPEGHTPAKVDKKMSSKKRIMQLSITRTPENSTIGRVYESSVADWERDVKRSSRVLFVLRNTSRAKLWAHRYTSGTETLVLGDD